MTASLKRIHAVLLRHYYILRRSPARLFEIMYWPTVQVILWGFISNSFAGQSMTPVTYALGTLLGAVMLWDVLFRMQIGFSMGYLEEVWARNMGHLFVSPLRPHEWCFSLVIYSFIRALIGIIPAALLAIPFYGFSIFDFGLPLLLFFLNLSIMGWWIGIFIISVLMRAGPGAESLAWMTTWALAPLAAVYYPVSVLPEWMQEIAYFVPASHVFEGMRGLVQNQVFDTQHFWTALGLNVVYFLLAILALQSSFGYARRAGTLLQAGE
jgi:ABC-2 type transport system permease protein